MNRPKTAVSKGREKNYSITDKTSARDQCPLDDPELPIVSELEHKTGRCFCHHCTCGCHSCGGIGQGRFSSSKSGWTSLYKSEFQPKSHAAKEEPFLPNEYASFLKTSTKPTQLTITQTEFKNHPLSKTESCKPQSNANYMKFSGRSSYEREFCDWKPESVKFGPPHLPYRGYMVKPWHLESSYKESFKPYSSCSGLLGTTKTGFGVKSLVGFGNQSTYETTTKSTHTKMNRIGSATPELGKMKNIKSRDVLVSAKNHYSTAYSSEFTPKTVKTGLTRLR